MPNGWSETIRSLHGPYRAAYWTDDQGAEVRLTSPEHAELPDAELVTIAQAEAERQDMDLSYGRILIGRIEQQGALITGRAYTR